jgi:hypothetical protein
MNQEKITLKEAIKAIDFTEITQKINKELEKFEYFLMTDIKVVKNE